MCSVGKSFLTCAHLVQDLFILLPLNDSLMAGYSFPFLFSVRQQYVFLVEGRVWRARSALQGLSVAIGGNPGLSFSSEPLRCSVEGSFHTAIGVSHPGGHKLGTLTQPIALDKLQPLFLLLFLTLLDGCRGNECAT